MLKTWRTMRIRALFALIDLTPARVSKRLYSALSDRYRMRSSSLAYQMRVALLRRMGARIGSRVKIAPGVFVDFAAKLKIGDQVSIQHYCFLSAYGGIEIGNDVSIGHGTSIVSSSHPFKGAGKIREAAVEEAPVRIGDNVWIGMKASILMGVRVGNGAVIGACSLVTRDVPAGVVAYGVPAKRIRSRRKEV